MINNYNLRRMALYKRLKLAFVVFPTFTHRPNYKLQIKFCIGMKLSIRNNGREKKKQERNKCSREKRGKERE